MARGGVARMLGAAVSAGAGGQGAEQVDLGKEFEEVARPHRCRLHEILAGIAGETRAHEDVQHIVHRRLHTLAGRPSLSARARVRFEWQQW